MSNEYEFYQGLVLRKLVVETEISLMLRPFVREGRINAFVVNAKYGIFIKHSAKTDVTVVIYIQHRTSCGFA